MKRSAEAIPERENGAHPSPRESLNEPRKRRHVSNKEQDVSRLISKSDMQLPTPANSFEELDHLGLPPAVSSSLEEGEPLELPSPPPDIEEGVDWGYIPGYRSSNDSRGIGENGLRDPSIDSQSPKHRRRHPDSKMIPDLMDGCIERHETIVRADHLPKFDAICTETQLAMLTRRFGPKAFDQIQRIAEDVTPPITRDWIKTASGFQSLEYESQFTAQRLVQHLFGAALNGGEASPGIGTSLAEPKKREHSIQVESAYHTAMCGNQYRSAEAFLFFSNPEGTHKAYNELNMVADFSISLISAVCDPDARRKLRVKEFPGFPCGAGPKRRTLASGNRNIIPVISGEFKNRRS